MVLLALLSDEMVYYDPEKSAMKPKTSRRGRSSVSGSVSFASSGSIDRYTIHSSNQIYSIFSILLVVYIITRMLFSSS
jgi:hypothetical protein